MHPARLRSQSHRSPALECEPSVGCLGPGTRLGNQRWRRTFSRASTRRSRISQSSPADACSAGQPRPRDRERHCPAVDERRALHPQANAARSKVRAHLEPTCSCKVDFPETAFVPVEAGRLRLLPRMVTPQREHSIRDQRDRAPRGVTYDRHCAKRGAMQERTMPGSAADARTLPPDASRRATDDMSATSVCLHWPPRRVTRIERTSSRTTPHHTGCHRIRACPPRPVRPRHRQQPATGASA